MAYDAFVRITSMSLGATESAISISEVQIIVLRLDGFIPIAFAGGFLMLVGLCLTLYESHSVLK